jgi:hypothetical protein
MRSETSRNSQNDLRHAERSEAAAAPQPAIQQQKSRNADLAQ